MNSPNKRYVVRLEAEERERLRRLVSVGKGAARKLTRARILLQADESGESPGWTDERIAEGLGVSVRTIEHVRRELVEEGLEAALERRRPRRVYERRLDGAKEAKLVAVCCSKPPDGRKRWTLRLLADRLVELKVVDSISYETVRQTLQKTS
jgi:transposase